MENEFNQEDELLQEELSFTDKFLGVVTNPASIFGSIAKFELKTTDWLLPVVIMLAGAVLFTILKFVDPEVKNAMWDKQKAQTIEQLKKENKSAAEIKQVEDMMETQKEMMSGPLGYVFTGLPIFIGGFIMFFIAAGIYLLFAKLFLHSPITYKGMMIAYALPSLVGIGGMVITTILTMLLSKMIADTSVASLLGYEKGPLKSVLAILDPIKLWSCYLTGVGMAKISNSDNVNKYVIYSISMLVAFYLVIALLGLVFPGLQNFGF
ncbi:MAG: YIP1 family protein [Ignavibacteriales bacterium]|nr:YIP1 family protein [Ignavibacteriales bacterium]